VVRLSFNTFLWDLIQYSYPTSHGYEIGSASTSGASFAQVGKRSFKLLAATYDDA